MWNCSLEKCCQGVEGGVSSLEQDIREGENPVMPLEGPEMRHFRRVGLFGNAAQNGW